MDDIKITLLENLLKLADFVVVQKISNVISTSRLRIIPVR